MKYDTTLKELFQTLPMCLLAMLLGQNLSVVEQLTVEFPSVAARRADLVMRLSDGRIYHLELQSSDDEEMAWRMLEYYWLIYQQFGQAPLQQVIYVGNKTLNHSPIISHNCLQFHYQLFDMRNLPAEPLLESNLLNDNLLAILCNSDSVTETIHKLLRKISALSQPERANALTKLFILAGLRDLETLILREANTMSASFDIRENSFLRGIFQEGEQKGRQEGEQKGRQEGEIAILKLLLEHKFGVLPQSVLDKLNSADLKVLESWSLRIFDINSLDELFN